MGRRIRWQLFRIVTASLIVVAPRLLHGQELPIVTDVELPLPDTAPGRWSDEISWIRQQLEAGGLVCSTCAGSVVLADRRRGGEGWSRRFVFCIRGGAEGAGGDWALRIVRVRRARLRTAGERADVRMR